MITLLHSKCQFDLETEDKKSHLIEWPTLNSINIYFSIFQVTVECAERGELLANLRKRYADLLDRIPRQVKR